MRGRRLLVDWQEDAKTLQRLYQRERDGRLRTRLHALWLLRSGGTLTQVAKTLGASARALQNWVGWYRAGGLAEVRRRRYGGPRTQGSQRLTLAQQEGLRAFTRRGTCFRVADAQNFVRGEYGVVYSYWGMWELLHRLRLRPKRPRSMSAKANPAAQAAWREGAGGSAQAPRNKAGGSDSLER